MNTFLAVSLLVLVDYMEAADLPCAARDGAAGQGKICVCNATYCDTTEPPTRLDKTQFHYYKTSNSSPGFTHSVLSFSQGNDHTLGTDEVVFKIDTSETFQEYVGIGGAFTDSSGILYYGLSPDTQTNLMKSYFSPSGIEYSLGRLPIGNTDFSERVYTLDDVPFDEDLSHFSLVEEDYLYRILMVQKAMLLSERKIRLSACTWSAPSWMRVNQTEYAGYISEKYNRIWAKYYIKILQAYKEQGLELWSISAGNEPVIMFSLSVEPGTLNSTLVSADGEAWWFKEHLMPELLAANFSHVKTIALEDQLPFLPYWMDAFKVDAEAAKSISGVAFHWYFDQYFTDDQYKAVFDNFHKDFPDKIIMCTEGSINGGFGPEAVLLGSWLRAEEYIYKIFKILDNWNVGYMDWNLFLDPEGGPSSNFGIDSPVIVNTTSDEFYKQPMFYAIGHFSKFIQPGSVKVKVTSNQNSTKTQNVAVENVSFKDVVMSFAKRRFGAHPAPYFPPQTIPQAVKCLATANPDNSFSVIVLNTKNVTVSVKVEDSRVGTIVMDIENNSINSFVYWP